MNTIQGKTALVTGASRGIGRATALALADAGASVLVHYRSAAAEANAVVAHIRNAGGRAHALKPISPRQTGRQCWRETRVSSLTAGWISLC